MVKHGVCKVVTVNRATLYSTACYTESAGTEIGIYRLPPLKTTPSPSRVRQSNRAIVNVSDSRKGGVEEHRGQI